MISVQFSRVQAAHSLFNPIRGTRLRRQPWSPMVHWQLRRYLRITSGEKMTEDQHRLGVRGNLDPEVWYIDTCATPPFAQSPQRPSSM
ncbi:hypothetical protein AcW1_007740 [Taiwanofungus camphoratus]|nr:hypothetical protein AcW1_007740 [Antrodia cinnamomea]